jgi:sigma-B regulation protein RsbU (phosphoserine phosphatase)
MERQNNLLFTIWYGVFDRKCRRLIYSSGGHPPAALTGPSYPAPRQLGTRGRLLGCDPDARFCNNSADVNHGSRLYVFSDGAYELTRPDGTPVQLSDLLQQIGLPVTSDRARLDELVAWAVATGGRPLFDDDVSILELEFQ